jgi:hypothetical protein
MNRGCGRPVYFDQVVDFIDYYRLLTTPPTGA